MPRITTRLAGLAAAGALACAAPAPAWHGPGHVRATALALAATGEQLPRFFHDFADTVTSGSVVPDVFRHGDLPQLRDAEGPDHYFDRELVAGWKLPATRGEFLAACAERKVKPSTIGTGPYAVVEWAQRLTVAMAEHRAWPKDEAAESRCLVFAGLLAHYAQDLCQPLHVTIHYDGRVGPDGVSPRTGIHQRLDGLLGRLRIERAAALKDLRPAPLGELLPAVLAEIERSGALVDRVYELEKALAAAEESGELSAELEAFGVERLRAAARFTASLYLTVWENSAKLKLPEWLARERAECPLLPGVATTRPAGAAAPRPAAE